MRIWLSPKRVRSGWPQPENPLKRVYQIYVHLYVHVSCGQAAEKVKRCNRISTRATKRLRARLPTAHGGVSWQAEQPIGGCPQLVANRVRYNLLADAYRAFIQSRVRELARRPRHQPAKRQGGPANSDERNGAPCSITPRRPRALFDVCALPRAEAYTRTE